MWLFFTPSQDNPPSSRTHKTGKDRRIKKGLVVARGRTALQRPVLLAATVHESMTPQPLPLPNSPLTDKRRRLKGRGVCCEGCIRLRAKTPGNQRMAPLTKQPPLLSHNTDRGRKRGLKGACAARGGLRQHFKARTPPLTTQPSLPQHNTDRSKGRGIKGLALRGVGRR